MSTQLAKASSAGVPAAGEGPGLPLLVERAGGANRVEEKVTFINEDNNDSKLSPKGGLHA
jgi:hypothetical protein